MTCNAAAILALVVGLIVPIEASAQLAGSAGAGNSAINGIPAGPANPSVLNDPSGIGNASRTPPLGTNSPAPPVNYGPLSGPSRRVATAPYAGASQRIFSAREYRSRKRPRRPRGRGRAQVTYTGICRGC